jgi:hypothetical protein
MERGPSGLTSQAQSTQLLNEQKGGLFVYKG